MSIDNLNQEAKKERLSATRRSFIKGTAVTIPAILTLHSGSALAAASSLSCIVKTHKNPPSTLPAAETTVVDNWGRVPTHSIKLSSTLTIFQSPANPTDWYDTTHDTNSPTYYAQQGTRLIFKQNGVGNNIVPPSAVTTPVYVLVEFDSSGNILGYGSTTPFAGASNSCLTSLAIKA